MGTTLSENKIAYINFVCKANKEQLNYLLCNSTDIQLKTICEIALNYILGNIPAHKKFDKRRALFEFFANREIPLEHKRVILCKSIVYRNVIQQLLKQWQQNI